MVSYENFDGAVTEIEREMLYAEMRVRGYVPESGNAGWFIRTGMIRDATSGALPYVAGPGVAGNKQGLDGYTQEFFNAEEIYLRSSMIPWIFADTRGMPKHEGFDPVVTAFAQALVEISVGGEMEGIKLKANAAMKEIETIQRVMGRMQGGVVDTFLSQYIDPLEGKVINLMLLLSDLLVATASERQLWRAALNDWESVSNGAYYAYQKCTAKGSEGEELKAALAVAGTALAIAGIFASGGTAIVLGLAAVGVGILDENTPEPKPVSYPGGRPEAVTLSMGNALVDLCAALRSQETAIEAPVSTALADFEADPSQYRLNRVSGLDTSTRKEDFFRGIQVSLDEIRKVARNSVPALANQFLSAANLLGGTLSDSPWQRDQVGNVPTGPGSKVISLAGTVEGVLREYHHNLTNAGIVLAAAADAYEMTDSDFEKHMREVQQKLN